MLLVVAVTEDNAALGVAAVGVGVGVGVLTVGGGGREDVPCTWVGLRRATPPAGWLPGIPTEGWPAAAVVDEGVVDLAGLLFGSDCMELERSRLNPRPGVMAAPFAPAVDGLGAWAAPPFRAPSPALPGLTRS